MEHELATWKPDDPEGTMYAFDQENERIIAKLPDGTFKYYQLIRKKKEN